MIVFWICLRVWVIHCAKDVSGGCPILNALFRKMMAAKMAVTTAAWAVEVVHVVVLMAGNKAAM